VAEITANGFPVLAGDIVVPQRGAWVASIVVGTEEPLGDTVEVAGFVGHAYRSQVFGSTTSVRVVGGFGGLRNVIPAKGYQLVPAVQVAQDIAADCGEVLLPSPELSTVLVHWARPKGSGERALTQLADHLGTQWRVTPEGAISFAADAFLPVESEGVAINFDGADGQIELGVSEIDLTLQPGVSYDGRKIHAVVHKIGGALRTTLHFDGDGDRIRGTIRKLVESSLPAEALRAVYSGRLVAQSGSMVDFVPDSPNVPGMQRIPLLLGIPGLSIQAAPGARLHMGFFGADGSKPFATSFESGSLLSYSLEAATYSLTCPSVQIGAASATPVAHAIEALAGMQAIAAPLAAIHASVAAATPATPVTNGTLAAFLAPLAAIPAALAGATATMPTLTTRIA